MRDLETRILACLIGARAVRLSADLGGFVMWSDGRKSRVSVGSDGSVCIGDLRRRASSRFYIQMENP